jgi:hypothetical protein
MSKRIIFLNQPMEKWEKCQTGIIVKWSIKKLEMIECLQIQESKRKSHVILVSIYLIFSHLYIYPTKVGHSCYMSILKKIKCQFMEYFHLCWCWKIQEFAHTHTHSLSMYIEREGNKRESTLTKRKRITRLLLNV